MRPAVHAITLALALLAGSAAAAEPPAARLQGTFVIHGILTTVDDVYGEHQGGRVQRTWTFLPQCATGGCRRVVLQRQRSGRRTLDIVTLKRHGPNLYVGRGQFWVALRCAGEVIPNGGLATETITVRITQTTIIGTTTLATNIRATYDNATRTNLTDCPGGIGHDAASYHGHLTSLPGPGPGPGSGSGSGGAQL